MFVPQCMQCRGRPLIFSGVNIATRLVLVHTLFSILLFDVRQAICIIFTFLGFPVIFLRIFGTVLENILFGNYARQAANLTIGFFLNL